MISRDSEYAIETFSLTKIFPDWWGRAKVIAVDNLDLQIRHNEVYGLLGPNGSGKTTTLKMLLNLLHPTKGKALLLGGNGSDPKISSRIGYLPEESYLYRYLSARETLDFYGRIFGLPGTVRKARIEALLDMVGLSAMANRQIGTYSKGMARRIGLAQALINDPDLLILDEPTSGMDPISTRKMKDLMIELAKRGKTILLCSHLLADVEDVCDRIGILYGGRMQKEGDVSSLLEHKDQTQILTGQISENTKTKIEQLLQGEHQQCQITSPMDKLEDFFIRTVTDAQAKRSPTSGAVSGGQISEFLASGKDKTENILDKLVAADVDSKPEEEIKGSSETESVAELVKEPDQNKELLEKLTQSEIETAAEPVSETQVVLPKEIIKEDVKEDVLKKLIGSDDDGGTERTNPQKGGEDKNA